MRRKRVLVAAAVVMALSAAPGARAALPGAIQGLVTDASGSPLRNICVTATHVAGLSVQGDQTNRHGAYHLSGLAPGAYRVAFEDCAPWRPEPLAGEWYDNATNPQGATLVVVGTGTAGGINAELDPRGLITGVAVDQFGRPAAGVCVSFVTGYEWNFEFADADGRFHAYTQSDTAPTMIRFGGCASAPAQDIYRTEWFEDVTDPAEATVLRVPRGTERHIEVTLERTGSISGVVRDAQGEYVSACAVATTPDGELVSLAEAWGDSYRIGGLDSGTYLVRFTDCHVGGHAGRWYDGTYDRASATPVSVTYGEDTPGIDGVLEKTGSVSGQVLDADGAPAFACVSAWHPEDIAPYIGTVTDEQGRYTLPRIQPRTYISFEDCYGNVYEWYDDALEIADATLVQVPPESEVGGIDAVIDPSTSPGPCVGSVSDIDGDRLTDCEEFVIYGTNAYDPDSDDDLFGDGFEVKGGRCGAYEYEGGSDPNDGGSTPVATAPVDPPRRNLPYLYLLYACR